MSFGLLASPTTPALSAFFIPLVPRICSCLLCSALLCPALLCSSPVLSLQGAHQLPASSWGVRPHARLTGASHCRTPACEGRPPVLGLVARQCLGWSPAPLTVLACQFLGWLPTCSPQRRHTAARQRVKAACQSLGWSPASAWDGRPQLSGFLPANSWDGCPRARLRDVTLPHASV